MPAIETGNNPIPVTLLDLVCRSALCRIRLRQPVSEFDTSGVLEKRIGTIIDDIEMLAKQDKEVGRDARDTAFWPLLEYKNYYIQTRDHKMSVRPAHLTPMIIHRCLKNDGELFFEGWKIYVGGSREVTGDYGEPAWERRVWLSDPHGEAKLFSGTSRETARQLYRAIAGSDFAGVDTLGYDDPHAAENVSYADMLDYLEEKGLLLIASNEDGPQWDAFYKLSIENPPACLALFDDKGRYLDRATGFWVSLRSERYTTEYRLWYRGTEFDGEDDFIQWAENARVIA